MNNKIIFLLVLVVVIVLRLVLGIPENKVFLTLLVVVGIGALLYLWLCLEDYLDKRQKILKQKEKFQKQLSFLKKYTETEEYYYFGKYMEEALTCGSIDFYQQMDALSKEEQSKLKKLLQIFVEEHQPNEIPDKLRFVLNHLEKSLG